MSQAWNTGQLTGDFQQEAMAALIEGAQSVGGATVTEEQYLNEQDLVMQQPTSMIAHNEDNFNEEVHAAQLSGFNFMDLPFPTLNMTAPTAPTAAYFVKFPCFLRYVDNYLMRAVHEHNHPPALSGICTICKWAHNEAPIDSSYVPLGCGHWLHYRCLVWNACQKTPYKDSCPTCHAKLFEWDGITVLMVAARTGLEINDKPWARRAVYFDKENMAIVSSDEEEYVLECEFIERCIATAFSEQLSIDPATGTRRSKFRDGSPDVTKMYSEVLKEMETTGRPRSNWLRWKSYLGYLLFCMLVATKLRRWLQEDQGAIVNTEGWSEFEHAWRFMQAKILAEVGSNEYGRRDWE